MRNIVCGEYESGNKRRFWGCQNTMQGQLQCLTTKKQWHTLFRQQEQTDILNQPFASVFTQEDMSDMPDLGPSLHPQIPDISISIFGVTKLLHGLNPNKAAGPDEVPACLLKECADQLAPALSHVFNASLQRRTVPREWRKAMVTPLFKNKKGEHWKPSNYRPVSLTAISCKVLEHIVHHHMTTHFDNRGILSESQHGFRKKWSCESQLILTIEDLAKGLDDGGQTDAILLDFTKAIDKVPHARLRKKLDYYGVRGETLDWISSFLSDHSQNVVCGGSISSSCDVMSGVPQGTVLGQLLFLAYINDLPDAVQSTM